jgi:hypothetical protein
MDFTNFSLENKINNIENNIQILETNNDVELYNNSLCLINECENFLSNIIINNKDYSKYKNKNCKYLMNKLDKINDTIKNTKDIKMLVDLHNKSNYIIDILLNDLNNDKNITEIN